MRPVFIVGPSRSGTELVRGILNRHPEMHIAGETHWFEDLRPRLEKAPALRRRAAATLSGLRRRSYGLGDGGEDAIEVDALLADADRLDPTGGPDALLAAYCQAEAKARGKSGWGEKTPRHVFAIDRILAAFPDAHIVAIIRDPRGAVASYRDWRNRWFDRQAVDADLAGAIAAEERRAQRSYSPTICSLLWRSAATSARRAVDVHGPRRVSAIRFEDLLREPEREIRALAERVELDFAPGMTRIAVSNSSYVPAGTVGGFDASVADRWRDRLSLREIGWIETLAAPAMALWGYAREAPAPSPIVAAGHLARLPAEFGRAAFANRGRIVDLPAYVSVRFKGLKTRH